MLNLRKRARLRPAFSLLGTLLALFTMSVHAQPTAPAVFRSPDFMQRQFVTVSDGTKLAIWTAGLAGARRTVVFLPGWTMPSAIFNRQVAAFSATHRVVAIDPRGQGDSEVPKDGYTVERRARDVYDTLQALNVERPVVVAWSLGVLEMLKFSEQHADYPLAGLVLVDNSVGEANPPKANPNFFPNLRSKRNEAVTAFVRGMFKHATVGDDGIRWLSTIAQRMPVEASIKLLSYPLPREYWRERVYAFKPPLAYFVTPRFAEQAAAVSANRPATVTKIFPNAAHAIFVDDAPEFDRALREFLETLP